MVISCICRPSLCVCFVFPLATGVYLKNHLIPDNTDSFGINLFPEAGPAVSVVTTNGIEAKASAIFVPESIRSCFTYSIR